MYAILVGEWKPRKSKQKVNFKKQEEKKLLRECAKKYLSNPGPDLIILDEGLILY